MRYRLRTETKNSRQMAPQAFREQQTASSSSFRSFHPVFAIRTFSGYQRGYKCARAMSDEKPSEICTSEQETDYIKLW